MIVSLIFVFRQLTLIYETFGSDIAAPFRIEEIVRTVVIPNEILAGVASIEIQKETQDKMTSRKDGT